MKCKFCGEETLMTVRDLKDLILPCCKPCKDLQNLEKQKLVIHMIIFPKPEIEPSPKDLLRAAFKKEEDYYVL